MGKILTKTESKKVSSVKVFKYIIISIVTILAVYLVGWISKDEYFLGSTTLCFGLLQVTLMMKGTWVAEVLALLECIMSVAMYVFNGLWGTVIFSALVYIPIGVYGIFSWKKNSVDGVVTINQLTIKKFIILFSSVVIGTTVMSLLLSLIPSQNFSILDSLTNMLNVCGILMINMRYKEGWFFWIACNIVESITWILIIVSGTGSNAIMMLLICVVYLILDVFAYRSFVKMKKKQTAYMIVKNQ